MGFLDNVKSAGQTLSGIANRATSAVTPTVSGGTIAAAAAIIQPERLQSALVNMALPDEIANWLTQPLTSLNLGLSRE